jgi:uncharacterized protein YaiI (UPF0178 family)
MKIWVDADACPAVIRDILFRAAVRTSVPLTLVANHWLKVPSSPLITMRVVPGGFDQADDAIVGLLAAGDLVISADLALAEAALNRGAHVLSPRGERYSTDTIRAKLTMRDFLETLRASGVQSGGPPPLSAADRQAFAGQLARVLAGRAR